MTTTLMWNASGPAVEALKASDPDDMILTALELRPGGMHEETRAPWPYRMVRGLGELPREWALEHGRVVLVTRRRSDLPLPHQMALAIWRNRDGQVIVERVTPHGRSMNHLPEAERRIIEAAIHRLPHVSTDHFRWESRVEDRLVGAARAHLHLRLALPGIMGARCSIGVLDRHGDQDSARHAPEFPFISHIVYELLPPFDVPFEDILERQGLYLGLYLSFQARPLAAGAKLLEVGGPSSHEALAHVLHDADERDLAVAAALGGRDVALVPEGLKFTIRVGVDVRLRGLDVRLLTHGGYVRRVSPP